MSDQPIEIFVTSAEAADAEVVEFWVGNVQLGKTFERDGQLVLRIEPRTTAKHGTSVSWTCTTA